MPIRYLLKTLLNVLFINENFFRWARPHKGFRRGVLYVRRSRKPAENAVQREKGHLWMDSEAPPAERKASGSPPKAGLKRLSGSGFLYPFVPRRASARWTEKSARTCLSPPQADEFPRAPAASTTRRIKQDTGGFFWFVFFHVKENERTVKKQRAAAVQPFRVVHQR